MANTPKPVVFPPIPLEEIVSGLLKVKPPEPKKTTKKIVRKMDDTTALGGEPEDDGFSEGQF